MKTAPLRTSGVLSFVLCLSTVSSAFTIIAAEGCTLKGSKVSFNFYLFGSGETSKGDAGASGFVSIQFGPKGKNAYPLSYAMVTFNVSEKPLRQQIFNATANKTGPMVLELPGTWFASSKGEIGNYTLYNSTSESGKDKFEAICNILANPSHYYINVFTSSYPDGAIRGQMETMAAAPVPLATAPAPAPSRASAPHLAPAPQHTKGSPMSSQDHLCLPKPTIA